MKATLSITHKELEAASDVNSLIETLVYTLNGESLPSLTVKQKVMLALGKEQVLEDSPGFKAVITKDEFIIDLEYPQHLIIMVLDIYSDAIRTVSPAVVGLASSIKMAGSVTKPKIEALELAIQEHYYVEQTQD